MPELIEEPIILNMERMAEKLDPSEPRDPDMFHVSTLVNEAARLAGRKDDYYPDNEVNNIMSFGRIAEYIMRVPVWEECDKTNSTFDMQVILKDTQANIVGTLDGLIRPKDEPLNRAIVEIKSKYSKVGSPLDNWRYMTQVMAYLKLAHTTVCWMPILYFPRGAPDVQARLFKIRFDVSEIDANWNLLLNTRDTLIDEKLHEIAEKTHYDTRN